MIIHNCHVHAFTSKAIPDRLLSFRLVQLTRPRWIAGLVRGLLNVVPVPRSDRLAAFVGIGNKQSQRAVLDHLMRYYPSSARFVLLALDFEQAGAGRSPQSYVEQLDELSALKADPQIGDRVLPFFAVDPRRAGVLDLAKKYLEEKDFAGFKLYPPLGFFPDDPRMDPIYDYAQANGLPVLSHCSRGGVYYRGPITDEMRIHPRTGEVNTERSRGKFVEVFSDPKHYRPVLEKFPELKINLAHLGGSDEWWKYLEDPWPGADRESWLSVILQLMKDFDNVYGDVSFLAAQQGLWPLIKVLLNTEGVQDRMLFGTDYYMVLRKTEERRFGVEMRSEIGDPEYRRMAQANPMRYLGLQTAESDNQT